MTFNDLYDLLASTGYPVRYHHFDKDEPKPNGPFIIFRMLGNVNFIADGAVYQEINSIYITLYTEYKDLEAEKKLKNVLSPFSYVHTSEYYDQSAKLFENTYEMEELFNG